MNFGDIFKESFLEGFGGEVTVERIVMGLGITSLIALYIFFVYRIVTRKTFYSKSFNISLAALSVITAAVIMTIQSSIVVSLGMVGALSIVRFRTAIKEPMDLVFLFWSIAVGIICGAGMAQIAIGMSIIITAGILILQKLPMAKSPLILVVNSNNIDGEDELVEIVKKSCPYLKIKSRNLTAGSLNIVMEVRSSKEQMLVKEIAQLSHVSSVSLLAHDGEVTF